MSGNKTRDTDMVTLSDYARNPYAAFTKQSVQDMRDIISKIPESAKFNKEMCDVLEPILPPGVGNLCTKLRSLAPKR